MSEHPHLQGSQEQFQDPAQPGLQAMVPEQDLLLQQQHIQMLGPQDMQHQPQQRKRVIHRHIHHHVHYHEGGEGEESQNGGSPQADASRSRHGGDGYPMQDPRQIELMSEAKVRAEMEASASSPTGGMMQSISATQLQSQGPLIIDSGAETPHLRRAMSMGMIPPGYGDDSAMQMTRTQEAFHRSALPQLGPQDPARRRSLVAYPRSVERALGSYADSGRPSYVRRGYAV